MWPTRPDYMKLNSKHIPFAELADLAELRVAPEERAATAAHLASCSDCARGLEQLQQVLELMRTDESVDAPRDVLAYATNIFSDRKQSQAPSLVRKIVAALTFDSSRNLAPAFGVRSGQSVTRQLIYSADEADIDLRISATDDQWSIAGQVLSEACAGGRVQIEGEETSETAELDEACEFTLPPVSAGSYTVRLRYGNAEVEISQLTLGA